MICVYCHERRAVNADHVIPRSVVKNRLTKTWEKVSATRRLPTVCDRTGEPVDPSLLLTVESCHECNVRKMSRLLIPASWADRLDDLNALNIGTFRIWDGSVEALREVVR